MGFNFQYYQKFKEIFKVMSKFDAVITDDIEFRDDILSVRLVRVRSCMTFNIFAVGFDFDYPVLSMSWCYKNSTANFSGFIFSKDTFISAIYSTNDISNFNYAVYENINEKNVCKLDYPLREEQVFQELTRFNIPHEEDINVFMETSYEVLNGSTKFSSFSFHPQNFDSKNETEMDNMVQSILERLELLYLQNDSILKE
ncbi:hypothetical protein [Yersinia phage fHe-Yen9-04]|uniref:Uncharacterized protein n=1 Tax=Yersinia phage fHe-Yen9-04 TaxID=2052742 RepID=A0A2C9CYA4_9CAUD|nr:hypothetical protein FDJ41_gp031 [Yersinia phage fHe-Yen9-04]SOK58308.1 hypothetical protein [Yersinia phage fHe-Yen9-04]VUE36077.1 hypothetical protein [Yersinia phage fHe-Yen9-04]